MTAPGASPAWLDELARRAARRELQRGPRGRGPARWGQVGISRRSALTRTAIGAAALAAPVRLAFPPAAAADDCRNTCLQDAYGSAFADATRCDDRYGSAAFAALEERRGQLQDALLQARTKAERRRAAAAIQSVQRAEDQLTRTFTRCVLNTLKKDAKRRKRCKKPNCGDPARYPPGGSGPAPSPNPLPPPGCPPTTFLCGPSTAAEPGTCCYDGTYCCGCACCIYSDCRCCAD